VASLGRAREQHVRDVRARDEQHERDDAEQHQKRSFIALA
jgi:hypothetical protein